MNARNTLIVLLEALCQRCGNRIIRDPMDGQHHTLCPVCERERKKLSTAGTPVNTVNPPLS
jgi:uncharacterized Zn finger protein (UPF0148 family)